MSLEIRWRGSVQDSSLKFCPLPHFPIFLVYSSTILTSWGFWSRSYPQYSATTRNFYLDFKPKTKFVSSSESSSEKTIILREGDGTPIQYSCLENPMDRGAWWAAVHGVAKSRARLSNFTFTFHFHALEKAMATHSSVLAWRIPGTGGAWWAAIYGVAQSQTRLKLT